MTSPFDLRTRDKAANVADESGTNARLRLSRDDYAAGWNAACNHIAAAIRALPAASFTLYGKDGSVPTIASPGTSLGTATFTDTANESAGQGAWMVPEGYKLVPIEPSEVMCRAGESCDGASNPKQWIDGSYTPENVELIYRAMLEAAPPPPDGSAATGSPPYWSVTVSINGDEVLTIEPRLLSGIPDIEKYADEIREAAQNLLSFIGSVDPEPFIVDDDSPPPPSQEGDAG